MIDKFNGLWQIKSKVLVIVILVVFVCRYTITGSEDLILRNDLSHIETIENDSVIEQSFARRRQILKRACRYLNKIIGVWISGSIHDLIHFHGLILNTTTTDDDINDFLSDFETIDIDEAIDDVNIKHTIIRSVPKEKIGET